MGIVTGLGGQTEQSVKNAPSLQLQRLATFGLIKRTLEIVAFTDLNNSARRRGGCERTVHINARQFSGTIE